MKKSDLKVGYVVVTRDGKKYMVMSNSSGGLLLIAGIDNWEPLSSYDDDLIFCYEGGTLKEVGNPKFDIVKVYGYSNVNNMSMALNLNSRPLLWEREEETQEQPANRIESLNDFAKEVHQNAVDHGWYDEHRTFRDIVALCHSELSEALEEYRKRMPAVYFVDETADTDGDIETDMSRYKGQKLEGIAIEMIDCMLRILDWLGSIEVDIENLLRLKHEYNKTRPYKHGGKAL